MAIGAFSAFLAHGPWHGRTSKNNSVSASMIYEIYIICNVGQKNFQCPLIVVSFSWLWMWYCLNSRNIFKIISSLNNTTCKNNVWVCILQNVSINHSNPRNLSILRKSKARSGFHSSKAFLNVRSSSGPWWEDYPPWNSHVAPGNGWFLLKPGLFFRGESC